MSFRGYLIIILLLSLISQHKLRGQESYASTLAHRVVTQAADVREGEKIVIFGNSEAQLVATEISKACVLANALPTIILTNDSLENLRLTDTLNFGIKYVNKIIKAMEKARVVVVLCPIVFDPLRVPNTLIKSQYNRVNEYKTNIRLMAQRPGVRVIFVNLATKPIANLVHTKFEDYETMLQKATSVESTLMEGNINRLSGLLKNGGKVRITNPMGTDISFLINNRPSIIDDGRISSNESQSSIAYNRMVTFPMGILRISVNEGSGMGRVIIPESECNYESMQGISFKINKGKIEQWSAKKGGTCFNNMLRENSAAWQVGSIGFSFNWEIKLFNEDGLRFWRENGGALIWITLGGNEDLGGRSSNGIVQFSFPIQRATVEIDDKVVIKSTF